jgi:hypothetical protein
VREFFDIESSLLDDEDGTQYRDVSFESSTWVGLERMLTTLERGFRLTGGLDGNGGVPDGAAVDFVLNGTRNTGSAILYLGDGQGLFKHLQVHVFRKEDQSPDVELTFFSADIVPTPNLRRDFLEWAESMRILLQAKRYFARYGSSGWTFGDTGPSSGVFLVSDDGPPEE